VCIVNLLWGAVWCEHDRRHQIEPQPRQIDQVVAGQRLASQVRVHEAYASKAAGRGAQAAEVGEHQLGSIAYDHELDGTSAADQHADLPARRVRNFAHRTGQLGGHQLIGRDASAIQALERVVFGRGQTLGIAEYDQLIRTLNIGV